MTQTNSAEINQAYAWCLQLAQSHYENFPVASVLLPAKLRRPIAAIYAFARTADDFADEGDAPASERIAKLNAYSQTLQQIATQQYEGNDPIFIAVADCVERYQLPIQLFEDLLIAFRQDVTKTRYEDFATVLEYCRYSANPVGRLILHLQGTPTEQQLQQSDAVCSSLQLINFFQDVVQDLTEQNRIYLPQDLLQDAGLNDQNLLKASSQQIAPVLKTLYRKTTELMASGIPLGASIDGRLGWEIRAMTLGGLKTLDKLQQQPDEAMLSRPRLARRELLLLLLSSAKKSTYLKTAYKLT